MNSHRLAYWLMVAAIAALILLLAFAVANPSLAAETGDVGCVTVRVHHVTDNHTTTDILEIDDGASTDVVGHYLWLQYAHTPSSIDNIVSTDLDVWPDGTVLTFCTDYVAEGVIPTGPGAAYQVVAVEGVVASSSATPHPSIVDAWVTSNGWTIL